VTFLGLMSMSAADLMLRRAALAVLESVAARDAAERRRHSGEAATFDGFEDALAERLLELIE
jgi:hypothetical protein